MLQYILDGGAMMIPLVALSMLALAVILDRTRVFRAAGIDHAAFRARVRENLEVEDIDGAANECERAGGPAAATLLAGLQKYALLRGSGKSDAEIEANVARSMSDFAPHAIDELEKRLNHLSMIGSAAPLLGMAGTVVGMIMSFDSMSQVGGLDGGKVAGGISLALVTTAAGLLIALPSVIFHNLFSRRVDQFTLEIEETANLLIDHIEVRNVHRKTAA